MMAVVIPLRVPTPRGQALPPERTRGAPSLRRADDERPRNSAAIRRRTILVVEDDAEIRSAIVDLLVDEGYEARWAADGLEALERLRECRADAVILDLMMPRMNGWEFRIAQRREPALSDVPVIAISADGTPKAAAIDATAYLEKPVDCERLLRTLERVLVEAERRKLDAMMAETERLASLGTLAQGLAHEINNPLAFVKASVEFLASQDVRPAQPGLEGDVTAAVSAALEGCERIGDLVREIQLFSSATPRATGRVELKKVLESCAAMAAGHLRNRAHLVCDYAEVPEVLGEPSRVGQIFLNLIINAAQAIPEGRPSSNEVRIVLRTDEGGHVVVEICDTGVGIPVEVQSRIFEPFFTTKPIGLGTGLGLSIVLRLVRDMNGEISFESAAGKGTKFTVSFPPLASGAAPTSSEARNAPVLLARAPRMEERSAAMAQGDAGRGYVLVIGDERSIGEMISLLLRDVHDVSFATTLEAISRIERGERFDVILCELMMSEVTGVDVLSAISCISEEQASRVVFMSGGAFSEPARQLVAESSQPILEKPFTESDLAGRVGEVIARCGFHAQGRGA